MELLVESQAGNVVNCFAVATLTWLLCVVARHKRYGSSFVGFTFVVKFSGWQIETTVNPALHGDKCIRSEPLNITVECAMFSSEERNQSFAFRTSRV